MGSAIDSARRFIGGNRAALFVGTAPLDQYLRDSGELAPLKVSRLLDDRDWRMFEQRKATRIKRGQETKRLCVSPSEPDAVMSKLKRGRGFAGAYKPSVLANEDRSSPRWRWTREYTQYACQGCQACPMRACCTRAKIATPIRSLSGAGVFSSME